MIGKVLHECPFCWSETRMKSEYTTSAGYILKPLNPVTEGHLLLIPHEHYESDDLEQVALSMRDASRILREHLQNLWLRAPDRLFEGPFNLIVNAGEEASQTVAHIHWHFVPRREGDGLMLPWTNQIKE